MKHEFVVNGESQKVILIPDGEHIQRDKTLNRLAHDGNAVISMDLRDDGALIFTLQPQARKGAQ